MILHITRFICVVGGAVGGYAVRGLVDWPETTGYPETLVIFIFLVLGVAIGYLFGGILGREFTAAYVAIENRLSEFSSADIMLGTMGLVIGLVIAWLGSQPIRLVEPTWVAIVSTVLLYLFAASTGVRVALMKRDDVTRVFPRLTDPGTSMLGPARPMLVLDTSAVIDGRFAELVRLGLLDGDVRVPRFVLAELQTLADSADDIKRSRGRRGLDLLTRIQAEENVTLLEVDYPALATVDDKLLALAQDASAVIVTVDFNLSKVGEVRDLRVINLNEVAAALKPAYLPGETLDVRIVRVGKEPDQGVGYLEDGTMIVVHEGASHVGEDALTEVTSVLQTSAGRMIFAKFVSSASSDES